jgi:hypothetical protein
MTKDQMLEKAVCDLAADLGAMHGTLFNLITALRNTKLTSGQPTVINAAEAELIESQHRFFAKYADMVGGAAPERN